mmetsp:Transcript_15450/g.34567  ORF Transcript_15450/g.34567 Transcript_15450/m.34567 type:complete len:111 (+) Transcript_15450:517-849(+)
MSTTLELNSYTHLGIPLRLPAPSSYTLLAQLALVDTMMPTSLTPKASPCGDHFWCQVEGRNSEDARRRDKRRRNTEEDNRRRHSDVTLHACPCACNLALPAALRCGPPCQ